MLHLPDCVHGQAELECRLSSKSKRFEVYCMWVIIWVELCSSEGSLEDTTHPAKRPWMEREIACTIFARSPSSEPKLRCRKDDEALASGSVSLSSY